MTYPTLPVMSKRFQRWWFNWERKPASEADAFRGVWKKFTWKPCLNVSVCAKIRLKTAMKLLPSVWCENKLKKVNNLAKNQAENILVSKIIPIRKIKRSASLWKGEWLCRTTTHPLNIFCTPCLQHTNAWERDSCLSCQMHFSAVLLITRRLRKQSAYHQKADTQQMRVIYVETKKKLCAAANQL